MNPRPHSPDRRPHRPRLGKAVRAFASVTLFACSTSSDLDEVAGSAALIDSSRGALSTFAFTSAAGTYGSRCVGRTGTWSLSFSTPAGTSPSDLQVTRGNSDCVLTVTSLTADQVYVATPPLPVSKLLAGAPSAFAAAGSSRTAFYGNAFVDSTTFASPFTVAFEVSDDPSRLSAGRVPGSYAGPSSSQSTLTVSENTQVADGISAITATVTARALSGKPLSGVSAKVTHSGSAVAFPATATTNAAGQAVFQLYSAAPTTGFLTAKVTGVSITQSPEVTFLDGYAAALTHFRLDEAAGSWNGTSGEVRDSGPTA